MVLIRLILYGLCFYFLFRYIRVIFFRIQQAKRHANACYRQDPTQQESERDQLVPCAYCGTYNPRQNALASGGRYFCGKGCLAAEGL